jgi:hypothetical protein
MKKYEWKMKSFAKGIDPDLAVQELERIESLFGSLTPENVIKASIDEGATLHPLFEWDNSKAAENYRLQQARTLINNVEVKIIHDGQPRSISVYEVVNIGEQRAYKHIEAMTPNDVEQVRKSTLRELGSLKTKLSIYNQFNRSVAHLDNAITELQTV